MSWHAMLHSLGFFVALTSMTATRLVATGVAFAPGGVVTTWLVAAMAARLAADTTSNLGEDS